MTGPSYREWPVRDSLGVHLACTWAAEFGADGRPHTDRILPDGCMDLIWTGTLLLVAGPDTEATTVVPRPGARVTGVRFWPGVAPTFLGVPAAALRDQRLDARDVMGARVEPLVDALHAAPDARAAVRVLEQAVEAWAPRAGPRDRLIAGAVAHLRATPVARPIADVARELGAGERQLHRRFLAEVGYGPKVFHRIVRLRRFLALARHDGPAGGGTEGERAGLAALAAQAGYADQAHLTRECRRLTGVAPTQLTGAILATG